ncbi:MAG: hypothetical protein PR2021_0960 [Candidatus Phytoplasma pruni]|nr:MAG: hypothetical protein PR2021_0960 [Candidatus Phytoplasma pruni]
MIQMINEYILFYNQKRMMQSLNYSAPQLLSKQLNNQKSQQI